MPLKNQAGGSTWTSLNDWQRFDEDDKELARGLLEGLILKHQAKQSVARQVARAAPQASKAKAAAKHATARA